MGVLTSWVLQWPLYRPIQRTMVEIPLEQARGRLSALSATIVVARDQLRKADDPTFVIPPEKKEEARMLLRRARISQLEARGLFDHKDFLESFYRATEAIVDAQRAFDIIVTWEDKPTQPPL